MVLINFDDRTIKCLNCFVLIKVRVDINNGKILSTWMQINTNLKTDIIDFQYDSLLTVCFTLFIYLSLFPYFFASFTRF